MDGDAKWIDFVGMMILRQAKLNKKPIFEYLHRMITGNDRVEKRIENTRNDRIPKT